ncbi:UNVERIFIED_CONTAM: hypothetical protein FKN15_017792 [Acipenser sinensis]
MEIEDLIKKLEQSTAAQQEANRLQREANRVQRQEWGLPDLEVSEPEVSELQPVLAKVVWPAPQGSPAVDQESQGAEQGSLVAEQDSPAAELEVLPLATDGGGGEEHTSTTAPVPCSILCDTLPECPDLPVLDLVARLSDCASVAPVTPFQSPVAGSRSLPEVTGERIDPPSSPPRKDEEGQCGT